MSSVSVPTEMYACRRPAALTVMLSYTNLLIHFLVWIRATAFPILPASLFDVFARRTCSCDKFKALALDVAIGQARSLLGHEFERKDDDSSRNGDGDCDLREVPVAVVEWHVSGLVEYSPCLVFLTKLLFYVLNDKSGSLSCAAADSYLPRHIAMPGSTLLTW